MIEPFTLIVLALAGWRVAYLLTNEPGPGNVMQRVRCLFRADAAQPNPGSRDQLFACVYCMAFWTTAAAALIWAVDIKGGRDALFFVAIWGAATAVDMIARRDA